MSERKIDEETGIETTGHSWDGIEELNNPLPRWWLWTFYATILWGIVYMILYPAWPLVSQATGGVLGWSARGEVASDIAAVEAANAEIQSRLVETELTEVAAMDDLHRYAVNAGAAVFRNNCSQCHGQGAAGVQAAGYPNLLDDDWLWGGSIEDIAMTVRHGIRYEDDPDTRWSQMPAFGEVLTRAEIASLVDHLQSLPAGGIGAGEAGALYLDNCSACHGEQGLGDDFQGAPNLVDAIWLYGDSTDALTETITYSRFGVMPNWQDRLSEAEIRSVAAYVHQLGGGE